MQRVGSPQEVRRGEGGCGAPGAPDEKRDDRLQRVLITALKCDTEPVALNKLLHDAQDHLRGDGLDSQPIRRRVRLQQRSHLRRAVCACSVERLMVTKPLEGAVKGAQPAQRIALRQLVVRLPRVLPAP